MKIKVRDTQLKSHPFKSYFPYLPRNSAAKEGDKQAHEEMRVGHVEEIRQQSENPELSGAKM